MSRAGSRRLIQLGVDLALVVVAILLAQSLRDNLALSAATLAAIGPYIFVNALVALAVLPALGINRAIWRLSALPDHLRLISASAIITTTALALAFALNRLDGVARSLPLLQIVTMAGLLIAARVIVRKQHERRRQTSSEGGADVVALHQFRPSPSYALVIGLGPMAELYIRAVADNGIDNMRVAGVLARSARHTGRRVHLLPVLGTPEDIDSAIASLRVHGVVITHVVIAVPRRSLSERAREALRAIETSGEVRIVDLSRALGLAETTLPAAGASREEAGAGAEQAQPVLALRSRPVEQTLARPFWRLKRAFDAVTALLLLVLAAPVLALVALLAIIDVGFPALFWQQRPGLLGRPFRVYKVRTMAAAYDASGRRLADDERLSLVGVALRRLKLDELPQLVSILKGDMSFIGPRPLLPIDQPGELATRLLIRPGLTGWAQVCGGRDISPADKAALDVWYAMNASAALEFKIVLRTVHMILAGEREDREAVARAWRDLEAAGVAIRPADGPGDGASRSANDVRAA